MRIMFIQGGSRWKIDINGQLYTDSNFNEAVWDRYRAYCDELCVILRAEEKVYSVKEASVKYNKFDLTKSSAISLPDVYRPTKNAFKIKIRVEIDDVIKKEIEKADRVVIRSLGNIYTNTAMKYAKKFNKPYLVEVTGFAWESLWYHSLRGKVVAWFKENQYRRLMKQVNWALYVTNEALQLRYPAKGEMLGCSDVEIFDTNQKILEKRCDFISQKKEKIVFGTAAFLDVGWKGQRNVISAISELKKRGINNIEYQLIGGGTGENLKLFARQLGVEDKLVIKGSIPHEKVYEWMDGIDIYIQPSYMEGLCRSIVEAMSRGCPVIASNVGGNYELVDQECLFRKGNVKQLCNKILWLLDANNQRAKAERNYALSKKYNSIELNKIRNDFYKRFINETQV